MGRQLTIHSTLCCVFGIALAAVSAQPSPAHAGPLSLATAPLANSTNSSVLPNLMFILDTSGSMGWDYLPDWAGESSGNGAYTSICKGTSSYNQYCNGTTANSVHTGPHPPFQSPNFNGNYYDPAIRYLPPVNADGVSWKEQTAANTNDWKSVKDDAYGIQSTASTNLVSGFDDQEWCTSTAFTDCLRNDNYILPGTVNGKNYTVARLVGSSGTKNVVTGSPAQPQVEARALGPHYYLITPGEYCTAPDFKNCVLSNTKVESADPDKNYIYPAKLRWCNSNANASAEKPADSSCQGLNTSTYKYPRFPTRYFIPGFAGSPAVAEVPYSPAVPAVPASVTFTLNLSCSNSKELRITKLSVGNTDILIGDSAYETNASVLANYIRNNNLSDGYTATGSGDTITIKAPVSKGNLTSSISFTTSTQGNKGSCSFSMTPSSPKFSGYAAARPEVPYSPAQPAVPATTAFYTGKFSRVDIVPGATYPRASTRTDCEASTTSCSYAEEMTNFSNWFTYYRTRMQAMKTAVSLSFKSVDNRYRVGFMNLWGNNYLAIDKFDGGTGSVKEKWYKKLFDADPRDGTPLRSALALAGRNFAGKEKTDPMQYSCQKNFTLLTTDGYWNGDTVSGAVKKADGTSMTNQDGGATPRPKYEGPVASSNSLADVAKYYYDTDLRRAGLNNCTGASIGGGAGLDVCNDGAGQDKQFMTTFTLGLGVEGTLQYTPDYKTASNGDYYDIVNGLNGKNWPEPKADSQTAVDDLWHAAVNGGGTYFSAKNPSQLAQGLRDALSEIDGVSGAGAAAATSTLNPVAGDNYAYVASYSTVKWKGNLEARTIDVKLGTVSKTAKWCVENVTSGVCNSTLVNETVNGSMVSYCATPDSTAEACAGSFDPVTRVCKVDMANICTGTMAARQLTSTSDDRKIYVAKGGSLVEFDYDDLNTTQQAYFGESVVQQLSQWATQFDATQKSKAVGANLVNYLRGHTAYEDRPGNVVTDGATTVDNRLYRYREATLGDATESQPAYVSGPDRHYVDPGYTEFAYAKRSRAKTVFIGTNDGMLHAFNADNGQERWAFIPNMVMPNLWKLADKNYAVNHTNYVNGKPVIADICPKAPASPCDATEWKTILVAGLNGGGRGYYALDITNPAVPELLWEIDAKTTADTELKNIGYSYGPPTVTKKADGTWVVLLTSGYNNVSPGDGKAYLFVRKAYTGVKVSTLATTETASQSGLARVSNWADNGDKNNVSRYVYGGDLLGNLWRFDINTNSVFKVAALKDAANNGQPITTVPELGKVNQARVIFVATGKYLEAADLDSTQQQTLYAIKDDAAATLDDPRDSATMFKLTMSAGVDANGNAIRKSAAASSTEKMDFVAKRGWWIDLPDSGERAHVDPILDSGLLIVPSTVPSSTVCEPGGYGWINYFDYKTGTTANNVVSQRFASPIVGVNVYYLKGGKRVVGVVGANDPTPSKVEGLPLPEGSGFVGRRVIWRELVQ
jgi:type IV pilus assembly protein PilY1